MKAVVISDSHGNVANIRFVLGFAEKIKAGAIIHCGDWDNLPAVEEVLRSKISVYGVLGNADVDPEIVKIIKDRRLRIKLGSRKIGVIHNFNHLVSNIELPSIVFCGHRHFKSERIVGRVKVVSPGALHSIKPSFAVYDTDANKVEFFDLGNE